MTLIAVEDIADYLGRSLSSGESTAASPLIERITAETESFLARTIEVAEFTETDLPLYIGSDWISVSHTPIRSVSSLTIDGTAWSADAYFVERSGVRVVPTSVLKVSEVTSNSVVDITYTAGLGEPGQSALKQVMLGRLARVVNKIRDDAIGAPSISVEGYTATYESEQYTEDERRSMDRWRRRVVAT